MSRALDRERRLLAGVCTYSGCRELAVASSEYCAPHRDRELTHKRASRKRRYNERRLSGECADCGAPSTPYFRCSACRLARKARRQGVESDASGVVREFDTDGLLSSVRPGPDRTVFVTLQLPRVLFAEAVGTGEHVAPCGHRVCSRDDGRTFCVLDAIRSARGLRQLDGRAPDERGARNGHEYALTVEQIAQLVGVTPRAIEQSLKKALDKLRDDPRADTLVRALLDE